MNSELFSNKTSQIFDKFEKYCQSTLKECQRKTLQFWLIYVKFVSLYHTFERSIRTGDHKFFICCLPGLMTLCFAFNKQNYSRWLVQYHDHLLRMEDTHHVITQEFENGVKSVRRTLKPFSVFSLIYHNSRQLIQMQLTQQLVQYEFNNFFNICNKLHYYFNSKVFQLSLIPYQHVKDGLTVIF